MFDIYILITVFILLFLFIIIYIHILQDSNLIQFNSPFYIDKSLIFPNQSTYSKLIVQDKINQSIISGNVFYDYDNNKYILKYDNGNSSLKTPLSVIKSPYGYILINGHHDFISAINLGSSTIPIKIIDLLSSLSLDDFYNTASKLNYIYPYDLNGNFCSLPKSFDDLTDDPNRYFALISSRFYFNNMISNGNEYPLWLKLNNTSPFIEHKISTILRKNSLIYQNSNNNSIPDTFLENARTILLSNPIDNIIIVDSKKHYLDITL